MTITPWNGQKFRQPDKVAQPISQDKIMAFPDHMSLVAIVDDDCDLQAIRFALRAADAQPPHSIERNASASPRDTDTTDRLVLKWRSARIEFTCLFYEPVPDASKTDIADITARILEAALEEQITQDALDALHRQISDIASYATLSNPETTSLSGMAYAQLASPFTPGFVIRSDRGTNIIGADRSRLEKLIGFTSEVILIRSAKMNGDIASIAMQAMGAISDPAKLQTIDRLRLTAKFGPNDPLSRDDSHE